MSQSSPRPARPELATPGHSSLFTELFVETRGLAWCGAPVQVGRSVVTVGSTEALPPIPAGPHVLPPPGPRAAAVGQGQGLGLVPPGAPSSHESRSFL